MLLLFFQFSRSDDALNPVHIVAEHTIPFLLNWELHYITRVNSHDESLQHLYFRVIDQYGGETRYHHLCADCAAEDTCLSDWVPIFGDEGKVV